MSTYKPDTSDPEWYWKYVSRFQEKEDVGTSIVFPLPEGSIRESVLDEAKSLITGDRNKTYGSPVQNFTNTAELWNVQFGHKLSTPFTASDVAQAMVLLKMARMIAGPKRDHWVDVAGYSGCGAECDEELSSG